MPFPSKQKTLFQTWKKKDQSKTYQKAVEPSTSSTSVIDLCDEDIDDEDLLSATMALEKQDTSIQCAPTNGLKEFSIFYQ